MVVATSLELMAGAVLLAQRGGPSGPQMRGDGPAPAPKPFSITRSDPALDEIIGADAKLETMATGFGINEGVLWVPEGRSGYVLVSSLIDNVIYKITLDKKVSVFMEKAGYTGDDPSDVGIQTRAGRSHVLIIGPNCAVLDPQGRLVWCAGQDRAVKRLEKDGTHTVLADGFEGKRFNGPNDITIRSDGTIYIADSDVGLRGGGKSPLKQLPSNIWRWKDGKVSVAVDQTTNGGGGNGIVLSPDEKSLYVTAGARRMMRYPVNADGSLGSGMLFAEGDGITDGMKVDRKGNIYSTSGAGPGIVRITSPEGKLLGFLNLPIFGGEEPKRQICATNVAFGGDGRDLYIAACHAVYRVRLKTPGVMTGPQAEG
jgi:gluconolactonase